VAIDTNMSMYGGVRSRASYVYAEKNTLEYNQLRGHRALNNVNINHLGEAHFARRKDWIPGANRALVWLDGAVLPRSGVAGFLAIAGLRW
jgi:hypothetical protein